MAKFLWKFTDSKGTFEIQNPRRLKTLYFPVCNRSIMGALTPELRGDLKSGQSTFLLEPCTRESLASSKSSRNFWVCTDKKIIWSLTGVSKDHILHSKDKTILQAGLLWHKLISENKTAGLKSEITTFCPSTNEPAEITRIKITNITGKTIRFNLTTSIPVYARSADNIRDHRHVTSLLNRVEADKHGIIAVPTMLFDESGHKINSKAYFVYGYDSDMKGPKQIFRTTEEFLGDDSDLEMPNAVYKNLKPKTSDSEKTQGREILAGLRFSAVALKKGESADFAVIMGISEDKHRISEIFSHFDNFGKIGNSLKQTSDYWTGLTENFSVSSGRADFDSWFKWVLIQPTLRKVYGCSFLPDFDYGKGGRGWRDLWQDALALTLTDEKNAGEMLKNNFGGIRIDGSNATIIGKNPGEFIADRNNISRVWMDHGIWPVITTQFYINQTGNLDILFEEQNYFYDHLLCRSREIDTNWNHEQGGKLNTKSGSLYKGTILEHMLVQVLAQFFNVGPHNHIKLENADWNDGLDMAAQNGESVTFSCMYAYALEILSQFIENLPQNEISVFSELAILMDRTSGKPVDYESVAEKQVILKKYFDSTKKLIDGSQAKIPKSLLIQDLRAKSKWMKEHIKNTEWLSEGFFNGYYNNDKQRVEGKIAGKMQMTLTGQVFPIMSQTADNAQIESIICNINRYLFDKRFGGIRLNTDFGAEQHNLGRAFSFIYGDKENGAFFNHMAVMYAYALLLRGYDEEGCNILDSIYKMSSNTNSSLIYPCLPEYFNGFGRGMYCYLTGSASWYVLTILTRVFGIRGEQGNLIINPNLNAGIFGKRNKISVRTFFADKKISVIFTRTGAAKPSQISSIQLNGKKIGSKTTDLCASIPRAVFMKLADKEINVLEVELH